MIQVKKRNGKLEPLDVNKINKCVERACEGIEDVSSSEIVLDAQISFYNKITTKEIDESLILAARSKIEKEYNYTFVASRLLLNTLYKEVFKEGVDSDIFDLQFQKGFIKFIKNGIKSGKLDPRLSTLFNLKDLAKIIDHKKDNYFTYFGTRLLKDRYLLKQDDKLVELPQYLWMRVAMGLSLLEDNPQEQAIIFYNMLSDLRYMPSTPTLFNSGTIHSQLSSCFLGTVSDSISGIFGTCHSLAHLSKYSGGLGLDITPLRATGSNIRGTDGQSTGIIGWIRCFNSMISTVDQGGGKRKGALNIFLEPWHLDHPQFLDLRKNIGDERFRAHETHFSNWITDNFMKLTQESGNSWYLFCPDECPGLTEAFGDEFTNLYESYVEKAKNGIIKNFKIVDAKEHWKNMLKSIFETGYPMIAFKDPSNIRYSNQHEGIVRSSNLCFTGDTIVATADGRTGVTIKQLAEESNKKIPFPVYSASLKDGEYYGKWKTEIKKAIAFKTGTSRVIKLSLADGSEIKCTPDHRLATINGEYVEAAQSLGCKLEPFYKSYDKNNTTYSGIDNHDSNCKLGIEVIYIEEAGIEDVYDLTVEDNHNFYIITSTEDENYENCQGVLVHNCQEILLHTEPSVYDRDIKTGAGEIATCNLASINLSAHFNESGDVDWEKLKKSVTIAIRSLDNVIDINFYPVDDSENSNKKHRPIGLGVMGWHDLFLAKGIPYDSEGAIKVCDEVQEFISYHAILASSNLAKERGAYSTFKGSLWDQGILPRDSYIKLGESRGQYATDCFYLDSKLDWEIVRESIKQHGMRNSNTQALAPNASISYVVNTSPSVDPYNSVLYTYSGLSGKNVMVNRYFQNHMKKLGLWDLEMLNKVKMVDGDLSKIDEIPEDVKNLYKRAYDLDIFNLIKCAAVRQKWIDMGQSFNIFINTTSLKKINDIFYSAWQHGLKTTYYLRNLEKSSTEKITTKSESVQKSTIDNLTQVPEVCNLDDEECLSCQ